MHKELRETASALVAPGKGILAADESAGTIAKRFAAIGVESTEENRRSYRELLLTTVGAAEHISGVILFDETIRQRAADGTPFPDVLERQGIIPGIKVDQGAKELALAPGEKVTAGLDGLRERLAEYRELGARFAKWRAVIAIGDGIPSEYCIWVNAHALARYAALAQEAGLVPIVEPEVLMDGDHDDRPLLRGDVARPARRVQRAARSARRTRGDALEAEHGALRLRLPGAGGRRRGRRGDAQVPPPQRPGGHARDRVPLGRPKRRGRDGAPERDQPSRAATVGAVVLLRPRAPGASASRLAG